ncbi:MAG: flagellar biosynthesis protein FlhA [Bacillus subtilis]|nr:flagellar biosynthesis protein FlhA [Bacillus subtilis]
MVEHSRYEYSIKTCPSDDLEGLEDLLNKMSKDGWDLYMLHETESSKGGLQYTGIFYREAEDDDFSDEVADVDNFQSRMEKMFDPNDEPYHECKAIQAQISQKQSEISKIKKLLDSASSKIDHQKLNDELSKNLKELNELKTELFSVIEPARMFDRINQDKLSVIVSDELVELVDTEKNGELISETVNLRQKLTDELGYVIPSIKFSNSANLEANEYRIEVRGIKVLSGFVYTGFRRFYPGQSNLSRKPKDAIEDIEPITGERVFWIEENKTKNFWEKGLSPAQVIVNALEYAVCRYVDDILDFNDVNNYLEIIINQNLYLAENLIPDFMSLSDLRYILANLIREKVSVKDLIFIFERLNDYVELMDDKQILLEKLRVSLARQISSNLADAHNNIYGIAITDKLAQKHRKIAC